MSHIPWLDFEEASAHLKATYGVEIAAGTIENKVYEKDIPSTLVAGRRRIHRDRLDEWALKDSNGGSAP